MHLDGDLIIYTAESLRYAGILTSISGNLTVRIACAFPKLEEVGGFMAIKSRWVVMPELTSVGGRIDAHGLHGLNLPKLTKCAGIVIL